MTSAKEKKGKHGMLVLEGELTLDRIRALRQDIINSLDNVQQLDVNLDKTSEADLSFLQLMCSAHRTAMENGKILHLTGDIPDAVQRAMDDNGYHRQQGCNFDKGQPCLWAGKKKPG